MTAGFSPTMDGRVVSQHPLLSDRSPVSADVPVMIGIDAHRNDADQRRGGVFPRRERHAQTGHRFAGRTRRPRIEVYRQANPERDAVGHLFPDRQRLPLRRADDEDRRAAGGARKGPGLPVLLPLGDAGRRRPSQVAAHDGDPLRLRQREGVLAAHRRWSGGDRAGGQDQRARGLPSPEPEIRTRRSCRAGRRSTRPIGRRWSSTTSARWRTIRFASSG